MPGFELGTRSRRKNLISLLGGANAQSGQVEPSSAWDGTPQSGFSTLPVDPVRTTAKPVVQLLQPPDQFFTDQLSIGVMAFANDGGTLVGGIDRVRFHFEGSTRDIVEAEVRSFNRADGSTYHCPAHWVDLKRPIGGEGTAHLYVEAIPADATMQSKVVGPIAFSMRDELYDYDLEVAPSLPVIPGQRYQSLGTALFYLGVTTGDGENCRITITEPGDHDFAGSSYATFEPTGYVKIEATAPVKIGHKTQQANDIAALSRPKINGLWFRGSNITFDFRYTLQLYKEAGEREHVFEGVTLTNSGGRETYWRKSVRPIVPVRGRPYYIDCTVTETDNATANAMLVRGVMFDRSYGDIGQNAQAMIGCKTVDHNSQFFATDIDALTVQGPTGATLSAVGSHNGPTRTFTAKESGTTVATFVAQSSDAAFQAATHYNVSNVVEWINSLPGWSATLIDDTRRAVVISTRGNKGAEFTNLDVSAEQTLVTMFDVHSDFYQQPINDPEGSNNVLIYGNLGINWTGQIMLPSGRNPAASDMFFVNNAFYTNPDNTTPYAINSAFFSQFARTLQSHVVFAHNTFANQGILLRDDIDLDQDGYCLLANNSVRSMRWQGAQVGTATIADNHVHQPIGAPQGATNTTTGGDESTLYANAANGDFTPVGPLLAQPKTPVVSIDINGNDRRATAAPGCIA